MRNYLELLRKLFDCFNFEFQNFVFRFSFCVDVAGREVDGGVAGVAQRPGEDERLEGSFRGTAIAEQIAEDETGKWK